MICCIWVSGNKTNKMDMVEQLKKTLQFMKVNLEMEKERVWVQKYTPTQIYIWENFQMIKNMVMVYIFFRKIIVIIKVSLEIILEKVLELYIENKNQNTMDIGKMIKNMAKEKNLIVMAVSMKVFLTMVKEMVLE